MPLLPRAAILKTQVGPAYALRVGPAYALSSKSDSLFDDYNTGAIDDLFAEPAPPAAKPEPKKTKRAAAADIFDDWFDQEPEKSALDEWDF